MKERGGGGGGGWIGWSERRDERERENGHENIYIECASGALLLQPTRPLFVLLSPVGLFPTSPLSLLRSTLCRSPSFYPPDKRRQPPTDSSANSVSELQDFSLPPPSPPSPPPLSRVPAVSRASRTSPLARKPGGWYRAAESPVVTYASFSLFSPPPPPPSIHHFPFPFLFLSLCSSFSFRSRNEKLRRYKHRRRRFARKPTNLFERVIRARPYLTPSSRSVRSDNSTPSSCSLPQLLFRSMESFGLGGVRSSFFFFLFFFNERKGGEKNKLRYFPIGLS